MSSLTDITTLGLGNTFGAWYSKTNEIINRLNFLDVASITGGDGISVTQRSSPFTGGFTIDFSGNVTKNTTFSGNVSIVGTLTYGALNSQMVNTEIDLPFESGVTVGNIVYIKPNGHIAKAIADDECAAEVVGVVKGISGTQATVITTGRVYGASMAQLLTGVAGATFLPGVVYFLSSGVSGAGTTIEPVISDYISKPVVLGLTSDTALILPYRGFVASAGISGTSTTGTGGVSAGVNSINSSNSGLYTDSSMTELRTDGDVLAVCGFNILAGDLPWPDNTSIRNSFKSSSFMSNTIQINLVNSVPTTTIPQNVNALCNSESGHYPKRLPGQIPFRFFTNGDMNTTVSGEEIVKKTTFCDPETPTFSMLYSTSGATTDVWRLKNIKITSEIQPKHNKTWLCIRTLNRQSCTNFLDYLNRPDYASQTNANGRTPSAVGLVANLNQVADVSPFTTLTDSFKGVTGGGSLFTPVQNSAYAGLSLNGHYGSNGDGATSGNWLGSLGGSFGLFGNVSPTTGGNYPIIYGRDIFTFAGTPLATGLKYLSSVNRTYVWNFSNTILGEESFNSAIADSAIGSYLESMVEALDPNNVIDGTPTGVTMEWSLLGWNKKQGSYPENISIWLPIDYVGINNDLDSEMLYNVWLEMKRYDINTHQDGETVIINKYIKVPKPKQFGAWGRIGNAY